MGIDGGLAIVRWWMRMEMRWNLTYRGSLRGRVLGESNGREGRDESEGAHLDCCLLVGIKVSYY